MAKTKKPSHSTPRAASLRRAGVRSGHQLKKNMSGLRAFKTEGSSTALLIELVNGMCAVMGISERDLCRESNIDVATLKNIKAAAANERARDTDFQTLRRLVAGLQLGASKRAPYDGPWFDLSARFHDENSSRRKIQRRDQIHAFTRRSVVWLQYQWCLEIACKFNGVTSDDVIDNPPTERRKAHMTEITNARHIALYLCHEELGAPLHLLARVAQMSAPSAIEAIKNGRKRITAKTVAPSQNTALKLVRRRTAQYAKLRATNPEAPFDATKLRQKLSTKHRVQLVDPAAMNPAQRHREFDDALKRALGFGAKRKSLS